MEEEKILSVVFPVEFIISDSDTLAVIRHANGQALRMCKPSSLSVVFGDILEDLRKSLPAPSAADKAAE